jgi:hypothetical protein
MSYRRPSFFLFPVLTFFLLSACTVVSDGTLSVRLIFPPDNTAATGTPVPADGSVQPRYPKNPDNRILIRVLAPHLPAPIEAWFDRSAGRGEITGIPPGTRIVVEVDEYDNSARTLLTNAPLLGRGWAQGITLSPGEFREVPITMYDKGTIVRVCGAAPASGAGTSGDSGDGGLAVDALLDNPLAVKVGPGDEIFVSSSQFNRIRKIDRYGYISHYAGNGPPGTLADGQAAATAPIGSIWDMDIGPTGDLYAINGDQQIFKIDSVTDLLSVKYNGQEGVFSPSAKNDLAVANDDEIYYTNGMDPKVYLVQSGVRTDYVWDNGASQTQEGAFKNTYPLRYPSSVSYNPAVPNLYFADRDNSRIKFVAMGIDRIYTKIGNGASSFFEGIDADNLVITLPVLCEYDISSHSIFFRERDFQGVRVLLPTNKVFNFTGIGTAGYSGDGFTAASAALNNPSAVAVDSRGNVYIADSGNHALRMVVGGAHP